MTSKLLIKPQNDEHAVVITKNDCSDCEATKELFAELGAKLLIINMDEQPEWRHKVKAAGFKKAPVVFTADTSWSGFNEAAIVSIMTEEIW